MWMLKKNSHWNFNGSNFCTNVEKCDKIMHVVARWNT